MGIGNPPGLLSSMPEKRPSLGFPRPAGFRVMAAALTLWRRMLRTCLFWATAAAVAAGSQAAPKAVPFYIFIGQSNSGWLGTAGLTPEEKAAYVVEVPETEIWNPANGGYGATWEPLKVGVNTRC